MRNPVLLWGRWLLLYAAVTVVFSQIATLPELRIAHGVLVYLLLIVGASREGGRTLSGVMVLLSYGAVDWFFVPPRQAFGKPTEFDLIILIGFLATATVISQLVITLRQTAILATGRAAEIERLGLIIYLIKFIKKTRSTFCFLFFYSSFFIAQQDPIKFEGQAQGIEFPADRAEDVGALLFARADGEMPFPKPGQDIGDYLERAHDPNLGDPGGDQPDQGHGSENGALE